MKGKILSEAVEKEIQENVEKVIRSVQTELNKQEIEEIIETILPDIDKIISNKIKQHFIEIAEFIINKFKNNS